MPSAMPRSRVSVLLPVVNESECLGQVVYQINDQFTGLPYALQIVIVDDGSTDGTWAIVERMAEQDARVGGISFSRNFGKEAAIAAGLEKCNGDCVILMDSDLQHPPELIPKMISRWEEGYQIVHGVKAERTGESLWRRTCSRLIYRAAYVCSGIQLQNKSDFKLLDREVIDQFLRLGEQHLFFRGLVDWLGFRVAEIEFTVQRRVAGKSQWSFWGLISYAANTMVSFTAKPLKIVSVICGIFVVLSSVLALKAISDWVTGRYVAGFPTTILFLILFADCVLFSLSAINWYLSKIFEEVKARPRSIIARTVNIDLYARCRDPR
jgi:glycosyltransferase involved in cell wall biosynthesis